MEKKFIGELLQVQASPKKLLIDLESISIKLPLIHPILCHL
jgi:hypothetical protein